MNLQETIRRILREVRVPREERVELYKDDKIIIVVPLTHRALQKYAHKCQWCINDDLSEWKDYHQGKHAVIIQRNPKKVRIGITGNPVASEILIISRWDEGGYRFKDVCEILGYQFKDETEMSDYYVTITNDINNFATDIVYYSPENGIYDQEDNFLWNFNYEISDIPNVTPEVIKIMDDYLQENEEMSLQENIRRILREETKYGGGIFYHNSDYDIESFKPQLRDGKKSSYLFFSNEPNTFIDRKYTYEVKLKFDPNRIFNTFKHINDYGIKYTLEEYKDEVLDLFENNVDYFIDEWNRTGVDSVEEVMEYFVYDKNGDKDDMVGLLYYFISKWNDSWAVIETDKFLDFIESKGYYGFVTLEEGLINIACNDFESIEIINKRNMW